ncbi:MAG: AraC family transcriptional regulator [Bauldia sp.]
MSVDALSDVLRTVRLTGAMFFDVATRAPWVAEQPSREMVLPRILPGAEHLISYHVVTEGRCYASIIGGEATEVAAGEVVVFTQGDAHVMSSSPGMRADPFTHDHLETVTAGQLPFFVNYGSEGPVANLVCGFLACDARPFNPLLEHLPRVIKAGDPQGSDTGWLSQFIRLAMAETNAKRAGGASVLARLSELMFIEVIRRYVETLPPGQKGWLAGLHDPFVGKALTLLHATPAQDWTIEELAKQVGLSRSVLAERFMDLVGIPPMHYLAKWRMQVASGLLSSGVANLETIAAEVGYASEASFSRAFKKVVGVPPSAWRRRLSQASSSKSGKG